MAYELPMESFVANLYRPRAVGGQRAELFHDLINSFLLFTQAIEHWEKTQISHRQSSTGVHFGLWHFYFLRSEMAVSSPSRGPRSWPSAVLQHHRPDRLWRSNPSLLCASWKMWAAAGTNALMLLALNTVVCHGDELLKVCFYFILFYFYIHFNFFWCFSRKQKLFFFFFFQAGGIFFQSCKFLLSPQRINFMMLVKCVLLMIRKHSVLEYLTGFVMY